MDKLYIFLWVKTMMLSFFYKNQSVMKLIIVKVKFKKWVEFDSLIQNNIISYLKNYFKIVKQNQTYKMYKCENI